MTRQQGASVQNNFSRGVITEYTGMNFPEDAATSSENVIFDRSGKVTRRLGIDYETDYSTAAVEHTNTNFAIQEFIWENVGGVSDRHFTVAQIGRFIHFWEISDTGSLSGTKVSYTINLSSYSPGSGPDAGAYPCDFSTSEGNLVITNPRTNPLVVNAPTDPNSVDMSVTTLHLRIRDTKGLDDNLAIDTRPSSLSVEHHYNVLNQGWNARTNVDGLGSVNVLDAWQALRSDNPSNADIWWEIKKAILFEGTIDINLVRKAVDNARYLGKTPAPKGTYLFNPFTLDRKAVTGLNIPMETSGPWRPAVHASWSGRIFYGGTSAPGYSTKIYFSRVIEDILDMRECYQRNDPTKEESPGVLPDDGGVINITDLGNVIKMVPIQGFLVIFATNGIWTISGSDGVGFTTTNYAVQKISDVQSLSLHSFVTPKSGFPMWWNADGIFSLQLSDSTDTQRGGIVVSSMTDETIQTLYRSIPIENKKFAKGAYSHYNDTIRWVYRREGYSSNLGKYAYDSVLVFDFKNSAFYTWNIPIDNSEVAPVIGGVIVTRGTGVRKETITIADNDGNEITDNSLDDVTIVETTEFTLPSVFRYLTLIGDSVTFSLDKDANYVDWRTYNTTGISFESYFTAGFMIRGYGNKKFQVPTVHVYSVAEENSSCYLQGLWDYSSDDSSGKETSAHQIYIDRSFRSNQIRKIRLRGKGYSLQFKFFSEESKPFNIIGWTSENFVNQGT